MPTIHETENEGDTKDEIERKEKEYQKKLSYLENEVEVLKQKKSKY
jgi:hypothetical protein